MQQIGLYITLATFNYRDTSPSLGEREIPPSFSPSFLPSFLPSLFPSLPPSLPPSILCLVRNPCESRFAYSALLLSNPWNPSFDGFFVVFFQLTIPPPKHEPVVIRLGEDSDSDSIDSAGDSPRKKLGSIFGGLDDFIKAARYSMLTMLT